MTEREAFEAFCKNTGRHPDDMKMAIWQAACAWQRERAARVCDEISADKWALYKGRPPYTGKEAGRASDFTQGQSDGADLCADKIRSGS